MYAIRSYYEGNAFDLAPLDRRFDFVFTFRLIRHFDAPERRRIYEQVAGRLRPGGHFLFRNNFV